MTVRANIFPKLQTVKHCVDHSLKSAVWEHPLVVNILAGFKGLWNLRECTFIIIFDDSGEKWLGKNLPYLKLKSWGCILTHWLPIASILFGIVRISSSLFKCNYLKKGKLFLHFLFDWWNLHQIWNIFIKKRWSW